MEIELERMPIEGLALGMHVSRLDRPWLETPFLFQGFTIKTQSEIDALRKYCEYVFVDIKTQPAGASKQNSKRKTTTTIARPSSGRDGLLAWLMRRFKKDTPEPSPGEFYPDTSTLANELPRAKAIHDEASSLLKDVIQILRQGGKLNLGAVDTAVGQIIDSVMRNQDAMTWLSRLKKIDDYSYGHSVSCSVYAIAFGKHLGLPKSDIKVLGLGGMLLDIGKTKVPKALLSKTDALTDEELTHIREHVPLGLEILEQTPDIDERVIQMVRFHHERYDGSGYPDGLTGAEIPVFARIAGIVDFFDAMITPRPYAPPVSEYDAMRALHKLANTEFQAEMVEHFVQTVGMFPNGALVELSNGEVGIVVEQNRVRRLRPNVLAILDSNKQPLAEPVVRNLRELPSESGESGALWIDRGLESGAYDIDPAEYFL